jgi:acylphosphatase
MREEHPKERCVRVRISGIVQGVGFRYATQRTAVALGVRGYVRNLPDRSVEAVFEGSVSIVEQALSFVRNGPRGSQVEDVEIEPLAPQGYPGFEIRN